MIYILLLAQNLLQSKQRELNTRLLMLHVAQGDFPRTLPDFCLLYTN